MNKFIDAEGYEKNLFFKKYCQNERNRLKILDDFKVELESYEDLPLGHSVYGAAVHGRLLWETIILFKVVDTKNKICYHPAFSESMGKNFARSAGIELPKKMTALNETEALCFQEKNFHPVNYSLLCLLEWSRWLILMTHKAPTPMPYGFWSIYTLLLTCPNDDVDIDIIRFINNTLKRFLHSNSEDIYLKCQNLQDYIAYIKKNHGLLNFKNSDFSLLRERLLNKDSKERIYF